MTFPLQLVDSHVEFVYDLGSGDKVVSLPHVNVSDGEWHAVFVRRYGNQAILQVDGGEGRFYAESVPDADFRLINLGGKRLFGGADVTYRPFHTEPDVNNVLIDSKYLTSIVYWSVEPFNCFKSDRK